MKKNQSLKNIILVVIFSTIHLLAFNYFKSIKIYLDQYTGIGILSYIITYILMGLPIFLGTKIIVPRHSIFESLGLKSNFLKAMLLAGIFALPMFIGAAVFYPLRDNLDWENLIAGTLIAGLMEELYFRGFMFGVLFKNSKLGFITSIFISALIFASKHIYQSDNLNQQFGIFIVTFMGSIFFAWLYVEWKYNLWVAIFLHTFMNLSWALFNVDDTALGSSTANIFRTLTIAIAILGTIYYKKKYQEKFEINKSTLLFKK